MPTSTELRTQRAALIAQSRAVIEKAEAEKRDLTGEEQGGIDSRLNDADALRTQIEGTERRERLERDEAELRQTQDRRTRPADGRPLGEVSDADRKAAVRAWALGGTDAAPTDADTQVRAARAGVTLNSNKLTVRALGKGTATAGGHLVPTDLVSVIEKQLKFISPIRGVAGSLRTDTGADLDYPRVNDTGNLASIVGEAATIAANVDPSFDKVTFKAFKYATTIVYVSVELLQDAVIDPETLLGELLGERLARGQNAHFATGNGTTQPQGLATGAAAGPNMAAANALTHDKIIDLIYSVDRAYRVNGAFALHDETMAAAIKLKDTTGQYMWQPAVIAGEPDRLRGYPVCIFNELAPIGTPGAAGTPLILFGDMSKYVIRDITSSTTVTRLNELGAASGQVGFVLLQRTDARYVGQSGCVKGLLSV